MPDKALTCRLCHHIVRAITDGQVHGDDTVAAHRAREGLHILAVHCIDAVVPCEALAHSSIHLDMAGRIECDVHRSVKRASCRIGHIKGIGDNCVVRKVGWRIQYEERIIHNGQPWSINIGVAKFKCRL